MSQAYGKRYFEMKAIAIRHASDSEIVMVTFLTWNFDGLHYFCSEQKKSEQMKVSNKCNY